MARKISVPSPAAPLAPGYLLRFLDLRPHVVLSRQTVLTLEQAGRFQRAVRFGSRCTLWRSADVIEWLDDPEHYRASLRKERGHGR
ncbi:helix-turn-helix transcriptional regulator [Paraburkholderia sartisoli]|uniref:Predicted DNA-binding transcriptional regulator AlpA n=1 Tax=Paraburkholderia sartisoli TaxID=83784 RepID=A0A1H4D113_9BURK|nr:AlpA family phage regulatory protein [Paraburkholderia sartisoli]SEA66139.1 Predicted DNA-binding transcriptional regulator AlpA [Paraburkholderia sartisoli]